MAPQLDETLDLIDIRPRYWTGPATIVDGYIVPLVSGGDGDPDPDPDPDPNPDPDPDEKELGEKGKKALDAERARARDAEKARKAVEKERDELRAEHDKLKAEHQSDSEKELDKARKEARDEASKEERARSDRRIVTAEIKAAAGTKFQDPGDAVRHLDLDDFKVNDDGDVDDKAISKALDDLLKDKPYLAADGKKVTGDGDQGPRGGGTKDDVGYGRSRLRNAYETTAKK